MNSNARMPGDVAGAGCVPCPVAAPAGVPCVDVWQALVFERTLAANIRVSDLFISLDDDAGYFLLSVDAVEIGNVRYRIRDWRGYPLQGAPIPGTMGSSAIVPTRYFPPGSKIWLDFVGDVVETAISLYLNVVKRYSGGANR